LQAHEQPNLIWTKQINLLPIWSTIKPPYSIKDIKIRAVKLSIMLLVIILSRFNNKGIFYLPINNIHMYATPKLIFNHCNLITVDNGVCGLLHLKICWLDDNAMHGFNHLPTSWITPMLAWHVFKLQKCKQLFHVLSKFEKGWPNFENQKRATNYMNFYLLSTTTPPTHTISTIEFQHLLAHIHFFFAC